MNSLGLPERHDAYNSTKVILVPQFGNLSECIVTYLGERWNGVSSTKPSLRNQPSFNGLIFIQFLPSEIDLLPNCPVISVIKIVI